MYFNDNSLDRVQVLPKLIFLYSSLLTSLSLSFYSNHKSLSGRVIRVGNTQTHLHEATLRILENDECSRLGAYKNHRSNKTVNVKLDVELCAARVVSKMPPEKWVKVRSDLEHEDKKERYTYEKAKEDVDSSSTDFFYGGFINV